MGITGKAYFEGSGDSSNTTSTGQQSYTAQVFWSGSAAKLYLRQHKNNVSSFVKSDIPVTWANGNTLRMEFRGNVIYTYRNGVEVTGMRYTIPALENDRFPDVCGSVGLFSSGGTGGTWEDFSCGYLTTTGPQHEPAYSRYLMHYTIGAVNHTTAKIGFQTNRRCNVRIVYGTDSTLTAGAFTSSPFTTSVGGTSAFDDNGTGRITLTGLTPGTQYYFKLQTNGSGSYRDEFTYSGFGQFKTFPAPGTPVNFTFAAGSCAYPGNPDAVAYHLSRLANLPAFVLCGGDNVYIDTVEFPASTLAGYREKYRESWTESHRGALKHLNKLRRVTSYISTIDDHEIRDDWSAGKTGVYAIAIQAYKEHLGLLNPDPITAGEYAYYSFQYGDVGFFITDGRSFKSDNLAVDNANKEIYGATQKAALKAWLLAGKSSLKVKYIWNSTVITSTGTYPGADVIGGSPGFLTARNEIWDYIVDNAIPNVVFGAGDFHSANIFKTDYRGVTFYEVVGSAFATSPATPPTQAALGAGATLVYRGSFYSVCALLSVDTTVRDPTVIAAIVGDTGANTPATTYSGIGTGEGTNPVSILGSETGTPRPHFIPEGKTAAYPLGVGVSVGL